MRPGLLHLAEGGHPATQQCRWPRSSLPTMAICGCATLTVAKIIVETADVTRFRSRHAYARHNGTAPISVWPGDCHRHLKNDQFDAQVLMLGRAIGAAAGSGNG